MTPARDYIFSTSSVEEGAEWVEVIRGEIDGAERMRREMEERQGGGVEGKGAEGGAEAAEAAAEVVA